MTAAAPVRRLGDVLVEQGLITPGDLDGALVRQRETGKRLGEVLVETGAIDWLELAQALAAQWDEDPAPPPATEAREPTLEELRELLRDRQRRVLELAATVASLQRRVEQLRALDRRPVAAAG